MVLGESFTSLSMGFPVGIFMHHVAPLKLGMNCSAGMLPPHPLQVEASKSVTKLEDWQSAKAASYTPRLLSVPLLKVEFVVA